MRPGRIWRADFSFALATATPGCYEIHEMKCVDFRALPGGELICQGLEDVAAGRESEAALLVFIGAPRLRRLGLEVPDATATVPEHQLYRLLTRRDPDSAHSRYNALIRRLVSFEQALECAA
jgi:hypothetical protein